MLADRLIHQASSCDKPNHPKRKMTDGSYTGVSTQAAADGNSTIGEESRLNAPPTILSPPIYPSLRLEVKKRAGRLFSRRGGCAV